ncbi:MAG: response regulator [Xanthobacteraceae bacterium]|nr:response regulator [Xanthobacteraceae bacterium]
MCAAAMVSARITPARLGINARTFECLHCNHVEKVLEAADPIQSNVLGWLFGELKPPT